MCELVERPYYEVGKIKYNLSCRTSYHMMGVPSHAHNKKDIKVNPWDSDPPCNNRYVRCFNGTFERDWCLHMLIDQ